MYAHEQEAILKYTHRHGSLSRGTKTVQHLTYLSLHLCQQSHPSIASALPSKTWEYLQQFNSNSILILAPNLSFLTPSITHTHFTYIMQYYIVYTCWEGKRCELSEEVTLPVPFVLNQRKGQLLSNAGGKVWAGLGGKTLPSFRWGWGEQQGHYLRALEPTQELHPLIWILYWAIGYFEDHQTLCRILLCFLLGKSKNDPPILKLLFNHTEKEAWVVYAFKPC